MVAKAFFVLCASALLVQTISAQCIGYGAGLPNNLALAELAGAGSRLAGPGTGYGCGAPVGIVTSGGGFTVTSTSPIAPTGITVISENTIEGPMEVVGQLPILATVSLEGKMPTSGAAGTTYGCGNGQVGITSESLAASGLGAGLAGAGFAGNIARAELAGAGIANNLARAEIAGAQFAGAGLAAANGLRLPCGAY